MTVAEAADSASQAGQLVILANRLPVEADETSGEGWRPSPGGLASALLPVAATTPSVWIGWDGSRADTPSGKQPALPTVVRGATLHPIRFDQHEIDDYYLGYANSVLWPLFHDAPQYVSWEPAEGQRAAATDRPSDLTATRDRWWSQYQSVNERFAREASAVAQPGATVWVHDYHLMLVPALLRALRPDLTILFFLHIPFADPVALKAHAHGTALLRGLAGAHLTGTQSRTDHARLQSAFTLLLPGLQHPELGVFAISLDPADYLRAGASPEVRAHAQRLRAELSDPRHLIVSVDRIDYTKGIIERMRAFRDLLRDNPQFVGQVSLLQVLTPTRDSLPAYRHYRQLIDVEFAAIRREFGDLSVQPVTHHIGQFSPDDLAAYYLAADVLAVTSLRDGMNLVAKEFVASRSDEHGVLLLSEHTGAADELIEALQVDPAEHRALVRSLEQALSMPRDEQQRRMRAMRAQVLNATVHTWAQRMLTAAARARLRQPGSRD